MKHWFFTIGLALAMLTFQQLYAQDSLTWTLANIAIVRNGHEIGIGEKVPDIKFEKMMNYSANNSSVHALNKKPLIIEFWHQYCSVCRSEIPKLNALYEEYKDSIQFLLVTFQSKASIEDFLQKQRTNGQPILLPIAVEDTLLRKTFGHEGDPHVVWINKEGVVQAISSHLALSKEHIAKWLKENKINLALKSNQKNFDADKSLFNDDYNAKQAILCRSLLTRYIDSISAYSFHVTRSATRTKLLMSNMTADQMFKQCYMRYDTNTVKYLDLDWLNKRILYKSKDSSTVANWTIAYNSGYDALEYFQRNHMYCYELVVSGEKSDSEMAGLALKDLVKVFHIQPSINVQNIQGLALIRIDKDERFKSRGINASTEISSQDSIFYIQHIGVWSLVNVLNLNYNFPFVADETGYAGNIDVVLPFEKNSLQLIKRKLQAYGLDLAPKRFNIPMLVLNDE